MPEELAEANPRFEITVTYDHDAESRRQLLGWLGCSHPVGGDITVYDRETGEELRLRDGELEDAN